MGRLGARVSGGRGTPRAPRVAVCGGGVAAAVELEEAERLGEALARAGAVVICGGLGGVMEAAARGAARAGGLTLGVLPGRRAEDANDWIALPLPTGMGEARNALVVRFAEAVVALGGEWGTLSEVALARKMEIPVVLLRPTLTRSLELPVASGAEEAAGMALEAVRAARGP